MKFIAHRGNMNGPNSALENNPEYILNTIKLGFDCEVDIRFVDGNFYLGHDLPQYKISIDFLLNNCDKLWIHCKNIEALDLLIKYKQLNIFWHNNDEYTITSKQFIWSYIGMKTTTNVICVMPELVDNYTIDYQNCYAICSDYYKLYNYKL
jgi:hypothetical protein